MSGQTGDMLPVDLEVHIAILTAEVGDGHAANTCLLHVDVVPLDIIVGTSAQPACLIASAAVVGRGEDTRFLSLIVTQFLIGGEVGGLRLIDLALDTLLALSTENLGAMSRDREGDDARGSTSRTCEAVVELNAPTKVDGPEVQANGLLLVAGIVDSESALLVLQLLDILDEDVAFALLLGNVGLQVQGVLVQGDEVLVAEQLQRLGANLGHITTNEQGRRHDAPHTEVRLVLHLRHRAANLQHVHVVVVTVVAESTQVEVLSQDALNALPSIVDITCRAP